MSLLLAYHDRERLVLAATSRLTVLPNQVCVSVLGRSDVSTQVLDGIRKFAATNPSTDFQSLSQVFFPALREAFDRRPAPQKFDRVVGVVCGWDGKTMRVLTAKQTKRTFTCSAHCDPTGSVQAFHAIGIDLTAAVTQLQHGLRATPAANRTIAFVTESLAFTMRLVAREHSHVSATAKYAAFEKDKCVELLDAFPAPEMTPCPR
jgi:hypothetical protein